MNFELDLQTIRVVFYANLMVVIGLCVLFGIVVTNTLFDHRQRKLFLCAITGNLFVIVCVIADSLCIGQEGMGAVILRRFTSFVNFGASPLIPILLAAVFSGRHRRPLYYLPAVVNVVSCLVSIFYPIVFFISYDNTYDRGPLFALPIGIALLYIVLLLFEPFAKHRRAQRQERMFLILIILLLGVAMGLEILLQMSYMLWSMTGLGLILYYLLLNVHYFTVDSLTGSYNRMAYGWTLKTIDKKRSCMITSMDLNGLKTVNDTQGHAKGDQLLINFAKFVNAYTAVCSDLYRIGGDEFILITDSKKMERYRESMQKLWEAAGKEGISFAYGEAEYLPPQNLNAVIALADERMYEMKKQIKAIEPENAVK